MVDKPAVLCVTLALVSGLKCAEAATCGDFSAPSSQKFARINYTLWREYDFERELFEHIAHIELSVPEGATFYHAMQIAQVADTTFRFKAELIQEGDTVRHYIYSISGLDHPGHSVYWVLYKLPTPPDTSVRVDPIFTVMKSVDDTPVRDGDNFLFSLERVYVR